jgi:polysaccharide deacetylase family protein (PEP-CTERM system associated)
MKHALSVDVEDWFQVLNMADTVDRAEWDQFELRCGESTRRLLAVFERRSARATFFFLGWIAERLPDLVREVRDAGHEIGSHGYDHRLLPDLGEEGFREDIRRTSEILKEISGAPPTAFRACTWSITRRTPWAFDILADAGIAVDSSVFPVHHPDYGLPGAPASPYQVRATTGFAITEFPPLTWSVLGKRVPVGGGGYLRLFPLRLLRMGLAQQERMGWPGCVYLHPWEVDPDQPRQDLSGLRGFRHYVNLDKTEAKLDALLSRHEFVGLSESLAQVDDRLQQSEPRSLFTP